MYLMHDTVDDLQALGRKLYEAVNTGDIPYANNGSYCHDRAYAMALKAERAGLPFEMAYFLPGSVDGMQVDGAVPWTAHVVIATPEMMIDGEPRRLFIDPSLFEGGPVGLQQVQGRLEPFAVKLLMVLRLPFHLSPFCLVLSGGLQISGQ